MVGTPDRSSGRDQPQGSPGGSGHADEYLERGIWELRRQQQHDQEAGHYDCEDLERLDMFRLTSLLNNRWERGWRLHTAFEQRGSAVLVFERRPDAETSRAEERPARRMEP